MKQGAVVDRVLKEEGDYVCRDVDGEIVWEHKDTIELHRLQQIVEKQRQVIEGQQKDLYLSWAWAAATTLGLVLVAFNIV